MSEAGQAFLLRLRGLSKRGAGGRPLLNIADLSVPAGGCVLLSGRNGAGKTTLLKIIAGLEAPDDAEVTYAGVTQPWSRARRRYAREVIYLHQQPYLFDCSVADNVGYGLRATRMRRSDIAGRIEQALETAELSHLARRNARELSGGEKQRVALTRALALAPRLLLLDEPLASLDEDSRARTLALIRALTAQPISIVLTSHERLSLTSLADYHYALADGTLTLLHGPDESAAAAVVPFRQRAAAGPAGQRAAPEGNE